MNKKLIRQRFKDRCINIRAWCRNHNISYALAYNWLTTEKKNHDTRKQQELINILAAEGLLEGDAA